MKQRRTKALSVRLTPEEQGYLHRAAELDGFTDRSKFVRDLVTRYAMIRIDKALLSDMDARKT